MRQKRAKAYRKLMALYSMSFGFRQPYQVLIDSEMCKTTIEHKIELLKQLEVVLHGTVKPMITQCCIHELYLQGKSQQHAVDLAKMFERRKCNHKEAMPGDDCLSNVVGDSNKHRYVVATQSQPLRVKLRSIPAVPIVHVNRSVMVLEPPSDATLKLKESTEEQALHLTAPEMAFVPPKPLAQPLRKKKGPKGPNPLSIRKKKAKSDGIAPAKKQKGKEKERDRVPEAVGVSEERVGEKRKRSEGDQGQGNSPSGEVMGKGGGGHKRKRRRKAAEPSNSVVIDS